MQGQTRRHHKTNSRRPSASVLPNTRTGSNRGNNYARRRPTIAINQESESSSDYDEYTSSSEEEGGRSRKRRRGWWRAFSRRIFSRVSSFLNASISNKVLAVAVGLFLLIQVTIALADLVEYVVDHPSRSASQIPKRDRMRAHNRFNGDDSTKDGFWATMKTKFTENAPKRRTEDLEDYCEPTSWQTAHFPTCNGVHEIDLLPLTQFGTANFLGNGLWRSVWGLGIYFDANRSRKFDAVIKFMRKEHDVTDRNFGRHQRDAIVMEKLSGNKYVVDAYGFCGNSVLTEALSNDLTKVIFPRRSHSWKNSTDFRSGKKKFDNKAIVESYSTHEKLDLAIGCASGMQAIHSLDGPVAHADVSAKQFLIGEDGNVKLNDFNRCRFRASDKREGHKGDYCNFRIPSAPGKVRSPEEYSKSFLTEKIDIYSLGHVFYGILCGEKSTDHFQVRHRKSTFRGRVLCQSSFNKDDKAKFMFADLIEKMYLKKASDRPSAYEIVETLKMIKASNR